MYNLSKYVLELGINSFPPDTTYKSKSPSLSESKNTASISSNDLCLLKISFGFSTNDWSWVCKYSVAS